MIVRHKNKKYIKEERKITELKDAIVFITLSTKPYKLLILINFVTLKAKFLKTNS